MIPPAYLVKLHFTREVPHDELLNLMQIVARMPIWTRGLPWMSNN